MLKECARSVTFDLAARAEYRDPERMEKTVYVSPLAMNVTPEMVKVSCDYCIEVMCLMLYPSISENVLLQEVWCNQVSEDRETQKEENIVCQGQVCTGRICS